MKNLKGFSVPPHLATFMIIELAPATSCLQWRTAARPKALAESKGTNQGERQRYQTITDQDIGEQVIEIGIPGGAGNLYRNVCVTLGAQTGMSVSLWAHRQECLCYFDSTDRNVCVTLNEHRKLILWVMIPPATTSLARTKTKRPSSLVL